MTATKQDAGKLRMDLIPPEALTALAAALTYGAGIHGDRNWEEGLAPERIYAALLRHLMAYAAGETADESGLHPLYHVLCNAAFLVTYIDRGMIDPSFVKASRLQPPALSVERRTQDYLGYRSLP